MFRRATAAGTLAVLLGFPHVSAAQTTTYHLHNENSSTPTLRQLKTTVPEIATVALQSGDLKNHPAEDSSLGGAYDTQLGVPGLAGIIPANATVTFTFWMKKTSAFGVVYPRAQLSLNWTPTATLCAGNGTVALTTTLQSYTFSCTLPSAVTMTTSDRLTLLPGYHMTQGPGNKTMKVELDIEGISPSTDSFVIAPNPVPPTITSLSPTSGPVNWSVTVTGTNFGATQGTLKFNGTTATPTSWSSTSIVAPVPVGATTGPMVVTVNGAASNGVTFTVIPPPSISAVTPASGHADDAVTITGTHFLATPDSSTVKFNGTTAAPRSWSDTSITAPIPAGATTGNVVVTVSNQASNGVPVIVIIPGTISGTITRATGGTGISGATVQAVLTGAITGSASTAANGTYSIPGLDPASYDVRVLASGFSSELRQGIAVTSSSTTVDVAMYAPGVLSGKVTQADGVTPIPGAAVAVYSGPAQKGSTNTNGTGDYTIAGLHPSSYTVQAANVGYRTSEQGAVINESATTTKNFSLDGAPAGPVLYAYDELGRLIQVTDPAQNSAIYRYDAVGNITAIERPGSTAVSISEFTPNAAPIGTTVLIYGTGFSTTPSSNNVTFNGSSATVAAATSNQLTVAVPSSATTGQIGVSSPGGSATTSTSFTVTAASAGAPTITTLSPQIWAGTGSLTITGTNFDTTLANDRVMLNGLNGAVTNATATSLTVQVPQVASSGHVSVTTLAGSQTSSGDFFVPPVGYSSSNIQTTARVTVGGSLPLSFPTGGKFSLLVFDGTPGHRVGATFGGVTVSNATAAMYDPNGARGASAFLSDGYIETGTIASSSSYTLLVEAPSGATGNATVTLTDIVDPTATITADGSPVTISTTTAGQNGRVMFSAVAGQRIALLATNPVVNNGQSFFCDMNINIAKPNSSILFGAPVCAETGAFIDTTVLPVGGTYTILIDLANIATGSLTLNLYTVPADYTGTITAGGSSVTATTTVPGQNGSLTFNGTTGQRISLLGTDSTYGGTPFTCDVTVTILKPDTSALAPATCMEAGGYIDATTLPADGVYRIQIDPYTSSTGSLTLTLNNVPADYRGSITAGGSPVTVTTTVAGQNGQLTFSGTTGDRISLQGTNSTYGGTPFTCDVTVAILNPDDSVLAAATCMEFGGFIDTTSLPATGTYKIQVDPYSATTGSLTLTLYSVPADVTGTITIGGSAVPMSLSTPGRNGSLTFPANANQHISLQATDVSGFNVTFDCDVNVSILKPDSTPLVNPTCMDNGGTIGSTAIPTTGTYTVFVNPAGPNTGSLTLTVTSVP